MSQIVFNRYYRALNPGQKEAVDAIDGPVFVIAGPGTGKTQILTLRIANILRLTDTPPDAILALAFTKSAVHSMRERLVEIMGSEAYQVTINTFHGFCNEVIQRYPEEFPRIIGAKNVSDFERIKLLEEVIEKTRVKILKPFGEPFYHLYAVAAEIEWLKKDNITPAEFTDLVEERKRAFAALPDKHHERGPYAGKLKGKFVALRKELIKEKELSLLYRAYEKELRGRRLYDFADMIMEVIRVLEAKPDFLLQLQEEYLYLLADEHQDANRGQNRLLELLASFHEAPNLFIVGDEKQAIFQFQGASLDNFDYFQKRFPGARLITLTENYRSSQPLLDASHSLIEKSQLIPADRHVRLRAVSAAGPQVLIYPLTTPQDEGRFLAAELKCRLKAGAPTQEIAVLYRDNQDGLWLAPYLEEAKVPFVIESESDILQDLTVRKLLLLLTTVSCFGDDGRLAQALWLDFLRLPPLVVYRLIQSGKTEKKSLYELVAAKLPRLYAKLERWQRLAKNESLTRAFGAVVEESGILRSIFGRADALSSSARLKTLYDEVREVAVHHPTFRLADFLEYLETFEKHGLVLREPADPFREGVRLMTVHKAKGLEFDYVYIINVYDGHFGNRRRPAVFRLSRRGGTLEAEAEVESERRLFYVALTRARQAVAVTYAKEDREGRVRLPSQFLAEIRDDLKKVIEVKAPAPTPAVSTERKLTARLPFAEKSYLNNLFLFRGLSVTDLNNYLECPLKYFFVNLLQIVKLKTRSQLYGTVVHASLKDFFDVYRHGRLMSRARLLSRLRHHLERQPFGEADFKASLEKGRRALGGYLDWYKKSWPREIINEFLVRGTLLTPQVKIKGRIDKVEKLAGREVRVVDYKTAKPKSRRELLGLTKAATGNERRQLLFYKLLLDHLPKSEYEVVSGAIDFIEPDDRGRYKKEEFAIEKDGVAELEELLKKTTAEILSLVFLRRGCGQADCRWCRLYEMSGHRG